MKNIQRLAFICTVIIFLFDWQIQAQTTDEIYDKFIKRYHTFEGTVLPYHLFLPQNYSEQKRYPLVLCLHGSGERGDDDTAVKRNSMAVVWARDSNQVRWPCLILVPQCPMNEWWTNSNIISSVNDIIDSLINEFPVDTNCLYVTGLSMGGYGTWDIITRFPSKFAAAIPVCGGGDPSKANLIKDIPIWAFHGAQDQLVPVINSRNMITALENAGDTIVYTNCQLNNCTGLTRDMLASEIQRGAKHLYTEYEYGSHSVWDETYNSFFLLPWTFAQSKSMLPSGVTKENYSALPRNPQLLQNYPNPFNPTTVISYFLPEKKIIVIKIYDLLGREIKTLVNETQTSGMHKINLDANGLTSGVYLCRMSAGSYMSTIKLIFLK